MNCFRSPKGPIESPGLSEQAVPRSATRRLGEGRRGRGPACVREQQARTASPPGEGGRQAMSIDLGPTEHR